MSQKSHRQWLAATICSLDPGNNLTHLFLCWVFNKTFLNGNFHIDGRVLFPMELGTAGSHYYLMGSPGSYKSVVFQGKGTVS